MVLGLFGRCRVEGLGFPYSDRLVGERVPVFVRHDWGTWMLKPSEVITPKALIATLRNPFGNPQKTPYP